MKVTGFDGKKRNWNLAKYASKKNGKHLPSKLHLRARSLLRKIFPRDKILEEVYLPGSDTETRRSTLIADFFLPLRSLVVEVHGRQHYEFVDFYHKTKAGYLKAKKRDKDKIAWCQLNDINIVVLKFSESDDVWRKTINSK